MKTYRHAAALLLLLPVSTFVGACGGGEDTSDARAALEKEALERELDLALQPDTTLEPQFADVAVDVPPPEAEPLRPAPTPTPSPAPAPRRAARTTAPAARPSAPRPSPTPAPEPSRPRTVTMSVPAGTSFSVRLNQELSTRTSTVGETFTATLSEPLLANDGTTLIPSGATVRGRVTESSKSGRTGQQAQLRLDFTSVSYGGETYSLSATTLDAEARLVTRDSKATQAAKVGGGAVAGAIIGRVIGKSTRATVGGAAVGAAAGTAVAIGTADVDAVIPSGARITARLDTPVRVEKEVS
ncbi:MAG: hypothetical protein KY444_09720 [Gemmatimonadetes bacterium]|nr:hypothetical protein [Gemmatimonadota bacterium]